jgi:hypothetical protein
MFVQTVTSTRAEYEAALRLLEFDTNPPATLVATVAFSSGDDEVTLVNVWESPGAMAEFFVERIAPHTGGESMEGGGETTPRGAPLLFWARGS